MANMQEGFGERIGVGSTPALIVVDMSIGFTDSASPLGFQMDDTVAAILRLLDTARSTGVPVVYTTVAYASGDHATARSFLRKIPALSVLEGGSRWPEIDPRLAPGPLEPVLTKLFASAFFGTPLSTLLRSWGTDTLVVTGASTSGCVRATVVDALQHGLIPIVPREGVGDRDPDAHEANLRDLDTKYADVVSLDEALSYIASAGSPVA